MLTDTINWDHAQIMDHIGTGLVARQHTEAYRQLSGQNWDARCRVLAGVLQCDSENLSGYLWSLVKKAPDLNSNGWDYRQELESSIVTGLIARAGHIRGNWELIKVEIACEFRTWYRNYSRHNTRNKIIQSVSLEREKWEETGSIDFGATLVQIDHDSRLDVLATFRSLPGKVRDVLERKIAGVPLLASERKRMSRWLNNTRRVASNGEILRARLAGKPGAYVLEFGKAAR